MIMILIDDNFIGLDNKYIIVVVCVCRSDYNNKISICIINDDGDFIYASETPWRLGPLLPFYSLSLLSISRLSRSRVDQESSRNKLIIFNKVLNGGCCRSYCRCCYQ